MEYRHVYSQTGGAQYGQASTETEDLLTVYAEAFERDANPEDFSLEAIVAHDAATSCWRDIRESASRCGAASPLRARRFWRPCLGP